MCVYVLLGLRDKLLALFMSIERDLLFIRRCYMNMESRWNDIDRGTRRTRRESCPSATPSTTNLTLADPGANAGLRREKAATNHLSHGMAKRNHLRQYIRPLLGFESKYLKPLVNTVMKLQTP
jgi:hypothetical protein